MDHFSAKSRLLILGLAALTTLGVVGGCSNPWQRYEDSLYQSLSVPKAGVYAGHADLLNQVVRQFEGEQRKPPPGILAEYGFYLARLGRAEEAKKYFKAEKAAYPESAVFVTALEKTIEGRPAFTPKDAPGGIPKDFEDSGDDTRGEKETE